MLSIRKIKHQVLNAKLHQKEAEIVAEAGKPGTVTIATNMAGRGTDIKLTPESKAAGGLAIIGTERHESRRVDRQLRGRSGRQGDPGSSQFFVSLEDTLMRLFGSDNIAKWMDRMGLKEGDVIQHSLITRSIERAQKKVEENNFSNRKNLLEYDDVMNSQREIIYKRRRNALYGDRLELDILNILYSTCESLVEGYQGAQGDFEQFEFTIFSTFGIDPPYNAEVFNQEKPEKLVNLLYQAILAHYQEKNSRVAQKALPILKDIYQNRGGVIEEVIIPFADAKRQVSVPVNLKKAIESEGRELVKALEKIVSLSVIDQEWKEHLRDMDDLRQSVRMVVHEQKDPLMVYKFEAFELFTQFVSRVNQDTLSFLMRADLPAVEQEDVQEARKMRREKAKVKTSKAEAKSLLEGGVGPVFDTAEAPQEKVMPVKSQKIADRNARVTVQYTDGTIKKDVKFKVVEEDLRNNKCVLVENK
jgi:preprotein translocase subunit SecA